MTATVSTQDSPPDPGTRRRVRLLWIITGLTALLVVTAVLSLAIGAKPLSLSTVFDGLFEPDPSNPDHAVVQARIPRTVANIVIGLALGLAGAVMQGVTRNPLADPGILGINGGAAFAVVAAAGLLGVESIFGTMWWALSGAALASVLVYTIAALGRDGVSPIKLALAGAALNAAFVSMVQFLIIINQATLDVFRKWSVGSTAIRDWSTIAPALPLIAAGTLLCLALARSLNGLALGDDTARALGHHVIRTRVLAGIGVVLLCGAATAAVGPIAFLGLIVPHAMRMLAGADYRGLLPLSALGGAGLLTASDVLGRVIAPPGEVQVAVMTALIGIPIFVWLVRRRSVAVGL